MSDGRIRPSTSDVRLVRPCWCGNHELKPFSEYYLHCRDCDTLVSQYQHDADVSRVRADESDLYGRDYWFGHMENDLGFANIYERAKSDLTERAPHWLKTLLRHRTPPGAVLELGSAHGGFVALLRWAGFEATGLELSPAIAEIAQSLFHVPMLNGPIEDQDLAPGSFDVIALMDVMEHLPSPVETMGVCMRLLKPGGFLLIQTPKFPADATLESLVSSSGRFLEQLKEREHLYLFGARSIVRFFAALGAAHVNFEPAYFSHYDMFVTVSREPLAVITEPDQEVALIRTPAGRLVAALLDLYKRLGDSVPRAAFELVDSDRAARLTLIEQQGAELGRATEQFEALRAEVKALREALTTSEADRAARLMVIEQQGAEVAALRSALAFSEADRAARLTVIEQQGAELGRATEQLEALRAEVAALRAALTTSEADRAARLDVIVRQGQEMDKAARDFAELQASLRVVEARIPELERLAGRTVTQDEADRVRGSRQR